MAIATALTVLVFAFGVRRLIGLPLSMLRVLAAGLIAFFVAPPIIRAMGGAAVTSRKAGALPGLWFVILGVVIALLVGMVFLVIAEALVPSGSLPGPLYLVRGTRRQIGRMRRYSQISRILVRRGLLPYQQGGHRSEMGTSEGRARLARSLRLALEDGGVTFIKLGQVLSTRRDLLPAEFISELSRLQDDAPQVPWPRIEEVLRSELGAGVDEVFASSPSACSSWSSVPTQADAKLGWPDADPAGGTRCGWSSSAAAPHGPRLPLGVPGPAGRGRPVLHPGGTGSPVLELPPLDGPRPHGAEILNGSGRHRSDAGHHSRDPSTLPPTGSEPLTAPR